MCVPTSKAWGAFALNEMSSVWSLNFKSLDKLIIFRIRIVEAQQLFDTRIIKYDLFIPLHLSNKDIYKHMSSLKPSEPWNGRKQQHVPWKPASHASLIRPSHFCTCYAHFAFSSASLEKAGERVRQSSTISLRIHNIQDWMRMANMYIIISIIVIVSICSRIQSGVGMERGAPVYL